MRKMAHNEWCLRTNETLSCGQWLRSKNGLFYGVMQSDGNFVIYRGDWKAAEAKGYNTSLWSTMWNDAEGVKYAQPGSYSLAMQGDGNLVIYSDNGWLPVWAITTRHPPKVRVPGNWAVLYDDGNFALAKDGEWSQRAFATDVTDSIDDSSLKLDSLVYELAAAKVTPNGGPRESASSLGINNTSVIQGVPLTITYTETKSRGWKTSTTLKVGTKTEFSCGVPGLAQGKVEVSAEVTQGFEWNETTTNSQTKAISLIVNVPPRKKVIGRCTWWESTILLPYKAVGSAKFRGFPKTTIPVHVEGVYEGVLSHDLETAWSEIEDDRPDERVWLGTAKVVK